jgi:aldehyde dehydrogenase (NAD+)
MTTTMQTYPGCYINGAWHASEGHQELPIVNPATLETVGIVSTGAPSDVDKAVASATAAFETFQNTTVAARLELFERIIATYQRRSDELAQAISTEMGCPISLSKTAQVPAGLMHLREAANVLRQYRFETLQGSTLFRREPIGVCGLITPWNWPMNQIACKVAPALAAGCTMILKPSEFAMTSAFLFAEILHEAGVPPGVFNMVQGDGALGHSLAANPDVAMISFTGSQKAGVDVARTAALTVKRITQELGGKSANVLLDDVDLRKTVVEGVRSCFRNSGQSCNAPTRMLVPRKLAEQAIAIAREEALATQVGEPFKEGVTVGPLVNERQFKRVQRYIEVGLQEGAVLAAGGLGNPDDLPQGYFVKPTVFGSVSNEMTIAREEIFGPVLCVIPYKDESDALAIANDTETGLSAFVSSASLQRAREFSKGIRSGNVHLNGARVDFAGAFGGYKQSGNGREWGRAGFEEYLELKTIFGFAA